MTFHKLSNDALHNIAHPMFKSIITSSNNNNYAMFSKEFSADLLSCLTQERFEAQLREFPLLSSLSEEMEFIDCIRRKGDVLVLYRLRSTVLNGEFLGTIALQEFDNRIQVTEVTAR